MSEKVKIKIARNVVHLPAIALRGLVVFPNNVVHFEVGRTKSIAAIEAAMHANSSVFLVAQREMDEEEPALRDLYAYGVIAEIKQVLRVSDDLVKDTAEAPDLPQKDTATEVAVSDDLEEKSIAPDGTTKDNGEGVKPPASVEAAKATFCAALDLVKVEKAAGVLAPTVRDAAVCEEYANRYSVEAMKLATEKLRAVGSAQRVAGVAPARHVAAKTASKAVSATRTELGALY